MKLKMETRLSAPLVRLGFCMAVLAAAGMRWGPSPAAADEGPLRRWAILTDEGLRETGVADLLFAELARQEDLVLVERQHIEAILGEWALAALVATEASDKRLELGRLLNADALVILSLAEPEAQAAEPPPGRETGASEPFIRAVVCESRFGARLRFEHFPYAVARREAAAADLARLVAEVREEYPLGVRQLIAVPHFLSRNLVRDHDHLQAAHARLLEAALMGRPGIAVLETEEARAIRRELELAGEDRLQEAAVPLFVEGEFEVAASAAEAEPAVRLAVRVWDGEAVRWETQPEAMSLSAVSEFLSHTVAGQIARLSGSEPVVPHDRHGLFHRLTARAETFSRLAHYEYAAELREAALLLDPEDLDQRLALIGDLLHWRPRTDREEIERQRQLHGQNAAVEFQRRAAEEGAQRRRAYLSTACLHLEYLLRRGELNVIESDLIASRLLSQLQYDSIHYATDTPEVPAAARAWFWRIYSLAAQLDPAVAGGRVRPAVAACLPGYYAYTDRPPYSALQQQETLATSGARILLAETNRPRSPRWAGIADEYYRFLTEVVDPELLFLLPDSPPGDQAAQADFYLRLIESGQPANVFRGRLELLAMEVEGRRERRPWAELRREQEALTAKIDNRPREEPASAATGRVRHRLAGLGEAIDRAQESSPSEKRWTLPEDPAAGEAPARRVVFAPVAGIEADWLALEKCGESLDVAWNIHRVDVIRAAGVVETIFRAPADPGRASTAQDGICSVAWDGDDFWIACRRSGISVVSPMGDLLGHIGQEQGLPPFDRGAYGPLPSRLPVDPLALFPVSPGRCLAVGQTPEDRRLWFARIDRIAGAPGQAAFEIDVFHTAVKEGGAPGAGADEDPLERFVPSWFAELRPAGTAERLLLVGRESVGRQGRFPLAIDLETFAVSNFPLHLPPRSGHGSLCQGVDGNLLVASRWELDLFEPSGKEGTAWQRRPVLGEKLQGASPRREPPLLPHGEELVLPGNCWLALDPQTWEVELLASPFLPRQTPFARYGVSAHYGLVGWSGRGPLYRFTIEPVPDPAAGAEAHYPFLPADRREAHHRAVQAIRRLGGSVDVHWSFCPHRVPSLPGTLLPNPSTTFPMEWRTTVYLPAGWKGGDEGLSHLAGLYRLADLYLVQAPISSTGLRAIKDIDTIESLYLVETAVTDAGLVHLRRLEELVYLRLEGAAGGGEFTRRGLRHLAALPQLRKLTIYGPGFSDEAIPALEKLPALEELLLLDTQITTAALETLAEARAAGAQSGSTGRRPFQYHHNPTVHRYHD